MKILILNGSPRIHGNISSMLDIMRRETEASGYSTETIVMNTLDIHPCTGCMSCRKLGKCLLPEDDAQRVLAKIKDCDALIIGIPCYWGNMPGQTKVLFDRCVYGMMEEGANGYPKPLLKGKKAIIVSTCTTVYPFNILFRQSRGAVKAMREILKWSGVKIIGTLEKGGTRKHPQLTEREKEHCRKIAARL